MVFDYWKRFSLRMFFFWFIFGASSGFFLAIPFPNKGLCKNLVLLKNLTQQICSGMKNTQMIKQSSKVSTHQVREGKRQYWWQYWVQKHQKSERKWIEKRSAEMAYVENKRTRSLKEKDNTKYTFFNKENYERNFIRIFHNKGLVHNL